MIMHAHFSHLLQDSALKNTRVDIWQFPLHTELEGAFYLLSEDERARAKRFHFPRHRRRFTVAHSILRLILARYLNKNEMLEFDKNTYGKPHLVHYPHLQFNLSHSGDTAMIAIGRQFPLGIDVEHFSARPYHGIATNLFSTSEIQFLKNTHPSLLPLVFFTIWVQKEAFIKAVGMGLSYPTQQFSVPALPCEKAQVIDPLSNTTWQMHSFMPTFHCCAALCHHPDIDEIRLTHLSHEALHAFYQLVRKDE